MPNFSMLPDIGKVVDHDNILFERQFLVFEQLFPFQSMLVVYCIDGQIQFT